jgi:hypothetical protein
MLQAFERARREGIEAIVFGDIFLEDLRAYRERLLARAGLAGIYPLWGRSTRELMEEFLQRGFGAVVVCVDSAKLDSSWPGRLLDRRFLTDLPEGIDPCGENGEYHTFVFDGPGFSHPVALSQGETVLRDPFCFRELTAPPPASHELSLRDNCAERSALVDLDRLLLAAAGDRQHDPHSHGHQDGDAGPEGPERLEHTGLPEREPEGDHQDDVP